VILDKLFTRAEAINLAHPGDPMLIEWLGIGQETAAGVVVTESSALNYSAVYSAVKTISETIGGLDRAVYMVEENGDSQVLKSHAVTDLINVTPNENMTPIVFWETLQAYLLLWGNAFAEIERDRLGDPIALWPRHPSRVSIQRLPSGSLVYAVRPPNDEPGDPDIVKAIDMLHVPCMGTGEVGMSVVGYARESLGLGIAGERLGGAFFGNGMKPGGILKLAKPTTRERKKKIAEDWKREFGGAANTGKLAVLDHDSDYTQIGIPPDDAQFLQTREFQLQEVCRWFRISPTKLMDFSRATFSNIEEINKQFASETISPWAAKWAQECRRKLLPENERSNHVVRHDLSKLVEGDLDTLTQIFSRGRQWGWYSINDVRRNLGENTIGKKGDEYLTPQNMQPVEDIPEVDQSDGPIEPEKEKAELLGTVGGMTGAVEVLTAVGQGLITHDAAVQMFMLFFAISKEEAEKLVQIPANVGETHKDKGEEADIEILEKDANDVARSHIRSVRDEFQALRNELLDLRKSHHEMKEELVAAIHAKYMRKQCAELRKAAGKNGNLLSHMDRYLQNLEGKLRAELETVTPTAETAAAAHVKESRESLLQALECQPEELVERLTVLGQKWSIRYA